MKIAMAPKTPQISLKGKNYQLVKDYCAKNNLSVKEFVSDLCDKFLLTGTEALLPETKQKLTAEKLLTFDKSKF